MSEREKKQLIYGSAAVLVIVALWLLFRGRAGTTIYQNGNPLAMGDISIPGFNMPGRSPFAMPDFANVDTGLSAIGACCTDCGNRTAPRNSYLPARAPVQLVINEGNRGPNIYNYYTPVSNNPAPSLVYRS